MKLALVTLLLVGCASSSPAPAPTSAKSAAVPAPAACDPTTTGVGTKTAPAGWTLRGHVDVKAAQGRLVSADARDASGKPAGSRPIVGDGKDAFLGALHAATCDAGGLMLVPNAASPNEVDIFTKGALLDAYAPSTVDRDADLAAVCTGTPPIAGESMLVAFAAAQPRLSWLTSSEWRAVQQKVSQALASADGRDAMKKEARTQSKVVAEAAARQGKTSCWYADVLQRYSDEK